MLLGGCNGSAFSSKGKANASSLTGQEQMMPGDNKVCEAIEHA